MNTFYTNSFFKIFSIFNPEVYEVLRDSAGVLAMTEGHKKIFLSSLDEKIEPESATSILQILKAHSLKTDRSGALGNI